MSTPSTPVFHRRRNLHIGSAHWTVRGSVRTRTAEALAESPDGITIPELVRREYGETWTYANYQYMHGIIRKLIQDGQVEREVRPGNRVNLYHWIGEQA